MIQFQIVYQQSHIHKFHCVQNVDIGYLNMLINNSRIVSDNWQLLPIDRMYRHGTLAVPETGDWIVPFSVWQLQKSAFHRRRGRNGLLIKNTDEAAALGVADFDQLALIAVHFESTFDVEPCQIAIRLREVSGWKGALTATGEFPHTSIAELRRFGFNAFELPHFSNVPESAALA